MQWALAYFAGAFVVFQAVEVLAEPWSLSAELQRTIHILLLLGFFLTLVIAWYHGEKGRQRVSAAELLVIALRDSRPSLTNIENMRVRTFAWSVAIGLAFMAGCGATAQSQDRLDAWVGFADKGIASDAEREAAYRELERTFYPRALERRRLRRTLPGLFDEHDLPLHPDYVQGVAATGARIRVRSRWLNGVTVLATGEQLAEIRSLPFVREVTNEHPHVPKAERHGVVPDDPDFRGRPGPGADPVYGWSAPQVRQLRLHELHEAGFRGSGVRIGVIDTGFLTAHAAFNGPDGPIRVVAQWDFMDNDAVVSPQAGDSPVQHQHGTLVLGTLAANLPGVLVGSAPDADYILLKAEDEATEYFLEERWFAAALEFAESRGADVVTSSVVLYEGYDPEQIDGRTSVMAQAWKIAIGNGIIGLQGGGNAGHDDDPSTHRLVTPAAVPGVITVGAVDSLGDIARFSSDGIRIEDTVKPEVLARGQGTATVSPFDPDAYTTSNGTSLATPLLAGAVACLVQAQPLWTVADVRAALFRSGNRYRERASPDPLFVRGYGIPDLSRAARGSRFRTP